MRQAKSFLLRFIGFPERAESPDWWAYLGSFGNDIFDDDPAEVGPQPAAAPM